jgi:putative heme iron utilization protein
MSTPTLSDQARALVLPGGTGVLSTHSREAQGFPFGSIVPFAADAACRPIFFISGLAMHTQNLRQDARASLFIAQPDATGDPLRGARVTLIGEASEVSREEVGDTYLARHRNAAYWQSFPDFSYWRLDIQCAYFVGGFGVMGWIAGNEYRTPQ